MAACIYDLLKKYISPVVFILCLPLANTGNSEPFGHNATNNFGLPGLIDLPNGKRFPDGEIILTQQIHKSLARSGISFQAFPKLGFSFRYSGHGVGGKDAYGRVNHDRSFDAHLTLWDEAKYKPSFSVGLRDFIGTGWYSSEYIVGTKTIGDFELTAGLGFGRLAGRDTFSNPFSFFSSKFNARKSSDFGVGGTFGDIRWFQGDAAAFYGLSYQPTKYLTFSAELTPDLMLNEDSYLSIDSKLNYGVAYRANKYTVLKAHYLHGSQLSFTANVNLNPNRPPFAGGKELAPVPMRIRPSTNKIAYNTNLDVIQKILEIDGFNLHRVEVERDGIEINLTNTKFRSTAQAVGRIASTLQRFTDDKIKWAKISFHNNGIIASSYKIDLEQITYEQYNPNRVEFNKQSSIIPVDTEAVIAENFSTRFSWGIGPYFAHRLFNPDLPLSLETGIELEGEYKIFSGMRLSGALRKSILTNFTENQRRSNSVLPRVHSDWPLYDFAGQQGHIHNLSLSYSKNLAPTWYGRVHAGLLEPFYAGFGGEILFKPAKSPFAVGFDIHHVQKRDYDMLFELLDYSTTLGHLSFYYDAGGLFDLEINAGKYLAGDWGATTTISRKFGSGWEVGAYATLTDVPFETFGEGSFDKAIYFSFPLDWILSTPNMKRRRLTLRPITRDGGANLSSSRQLYSSIEKLQSSALKREIGRLWK